MHVDQNLFINEYNSIIIFNWSMVFSSLSVILMKFSNKEHNSGNFILCITFTTTCHYKVYTKDP